MSTEDDDDLEEFGLAMEKAASAPEAGSTGSDTLPDAPSALGSNAFGAGISWPTVGPGVQTREVRFGEIPAASSGRHLTMQQIEDWAKSR